jgi:hypothetical protein
MKRLVIGSLVAAVVMFFWGFVFWQVLPAKFAVMKGVPNDAEVMEVLKKNLPESGVYLAPYPDEAALSGDNKAAREELAKRHEAGPLVQITYRKEGVKMLNPLVFAAGFGHFLLSALVGALLLQFALPNLPSYLCRVGYVGLLGLFAGLFIDLSTPIWFHHPIVFPAYNFAYHATSWLVAGLVLGAIVKPE